MDTGRPRFAGLLGKTPSKTAKIAKKNAEGAKHELPVVRVLRISLSVEVQSLNKPVR